MYTVVNNQIDGKPLGIRIYNIIIIILRQHARLGTLLRYQAQSKFFFFACAFDHCPISIYDALVLLNKHCDTR